MNKYVLVGALVALFGCSKEAPPTASLGTPTTGATGTSAATAAQEDPDSVLAPATSDALKTIAHVAAGSKDHTTLFAALKAGRYVAPLATPGPFTVFAPTNAAFDKLPKGTVESLVKPEKLQDLQTILKYHVVTSEYDAKSFKDGQTLGTVQGAKVTFHVKDGKVMVNDANLVASIKTWNGIVHVIDAVLLPPAAK